MDYFIHKVFAINYKVALFHYEEAKKTEDGQFYNLMSSLLFCAFSLEAYLNHQGYSEEEDVWDQWDKEKKPSIKDKLARLSAIYTYKFDFNSCLYNDIILLFKFRDSIVHGRTEVISKKVVKPQNNRQGARNNLSSKIEKFCTLKNTEKMCRSVKEIIEDFNERSENKLPKHYLWSIGNGSYRVYKNS